MTRNIPRYELHTSGPVRIVAPLRLEILIDSRMRSRFPLKSRGMLGSVAAATVTKAIFSELSGGARFNIAARHFRAEIAEYFHASLLSFAARVRALLGAYVIATVAPSAMSCSGFTGELRWWNGCVDFNNLFSYSGSPNLCFTILTISVHSIMAPDPTSPHTRVFSTGIKTSNQPWLRTASPSDP